MKRRGFCLVTGLANDLVSHWIARLLGSGDKGPRLDGSPQAIAAARSGESWPAWAS